MLNLSKVVEFYQQGTENTHRSELLLSYSTTRVTQWYRLFAQSRTLQSV